MAALKRLANMSHSYAQNHIHLVFSTKNRLKLISKDIQPRLWAYIAGICNNQNMLAFAVGGIEDHIHVLFRLPPTITLARAVTLIKSNSSKWIREKGIKFAWQEGYGAFAVIRDAVFLQHRDKFLFKGEFAMMRCLIVDVPDDRRYLG
jgi:REP-associated tyrosine transposase